MKKDIAIKASATGAAAGFVTGFLGAGGGMILVPLLIGWCHLKDKDAFASSVAITLPVCLVSILTTAAGTPLPWSDALPYFIGGTVGGIFAGMFFKKVPDLWLHRILGLFILWGGIRMIFL